MSATGSVVGLVLAGGRSVRFGGEKAVALLDGRPLLEWAAQRLESVCLSVAINVRTGTQAEAVAKALALPTLYDAPGDAAGPLAGVKAGLIWAEEQGARMLAVSPCDAPLLPDELYVRLLERAQGGAAMAETSDGRQPLCAIWPVTALPAAPALTRRPGNCSSASVPATCCSSARTRSPTSTRETTWPRYRHSARACVDRRLWQHVDPLSAALAH
jgi:molybdopterin-guanine dinucleotide biosynthesis protein A